MASDCIVQPGSRPPCGRTPSVPARDLLKSIPSHTRAVGKFLLSPLSKQTPSGQYAASLSIRSGRGSGTHDRVFRFIPVFPTPQAAMQYALEQGLGYLRLSGLPA